MGNSRVVRTEVQDTHTHTHKQFSHSSCAGTATLCVILVCSPVMFVAGVWFVSDRQRAGKQGDPHCACLPVMASYEDRPQPPARGASVREFKNGQPTEKEKKKGFFSRKGQGVPLPSPLPYPSLPFSPLLPSSLPSFLHLFSSLSSLPPHLPTSLLPSFSGISHPSPLFHPPSFLSSLPLSFFPTLIPFLLSSCSSFLTFLHLLLSFLSVSLLYSHLTSPPCFSFSFMQRKQDLKFHLQLTLNTRFMSVLIL